MTGTADELAKIVTQLSKLSEKVLGASDLERPYTATPRQNTLSRINLVRE